MGAPTHADIIELKNFLLQLRNQKSGSKTVCDFSIILILKEITTFYSQRVHAFCLKKNINFNKNETESKMESTTDSFKRTLCFSSYKNCKLKVKLRWVRAHERIKSVFFVLFISFEGNLFNICVLSQCILYWIHFPNIHTFTYQKTCIIQSCI